MTNRNRGFSLLEILVVLVVLGILLGIAGFLFKGVLQRQRLNEATRTFGETLRRISETAVTKSQTVTTTITTNGVTWKDEDNVTGSASLPYEAKIGGFAPTTLPVTITFNGRGLPTGGGNRFSVGIGTQTRRVNLVPTGAVTYP